MVELHLHSPIRLHGVVLNNLSNGRNLPFTFISLFSLFWKNKVRLLISCCCLCLCSPSPKYLKAGSCLVYITSGQTAEKTPLFNSWMHCFFLCGLCHIKRKEAISSFQNLTVYHSNQYKDELVLDLLVALMKPCSSLCRVDK
jgi:hypothetical protein